MLIVALGLQPPEVHTSLVWFVVALIAGICSLAWFRGIGSTRNLTLLGLLALALPLAWAGQAPAAALAPLSLFVIAAVLGFSVQGASDAPIPRLPLAAMAGTAALAALHGVYQRVIGLPRLVEALAQHPDLPNQQELVARAAMGRGFAGFSTPAALGGFLVMAAAMTAGWALSATTRRERLGAWALVLVQLVGLVVSQSATATAAGIGAVGLAVVLSGRRSWRWVWALGGLAVVLAIVVVSRGDKLISADAVGSPWRFRAGNFRSALAMTADHPWVGVGPGAFADRYPSYRQPGDNETRHVHNVALEFLAETGIPLGSLFSAMFLVLFLGPLIRQRDANDPRRLGVAVGLATFALHNLADFTAYMPSLLWIAAMWRGLIAHAGVPRSDASMHRALRIATLVLVFVALTLWVLQGTSRESRQAARKAAFAGDHTQARALAYRAARLAPWDPDAAVFLSRASLQDSPAFALAEAERGVRLAPFQPAARQTRATARVANQDLAGALADMRIACELYPLSTEYASQRRQLERALAQRIPRETP